MCETVREREREITCEFIDTGFQVAECSYIRKSGRCVPSLIVMQKLVSREREIKTFCPEMVADEEKGVVVAKKVRGEIEKKEGTHVLSTLSLSFSDRT